VRIPSRAGHDAVLVCAKHGAIDSSAADVREAPGDHPLRLVLGKHSLLAARARGCRARRTALVIGAEADIRTSVARWRRPDVGDRRGARAMPGRPRFDRWCALDLQDLGVLRWAFVRGGSKVVRRSRSRKARRRLCSELERVLGRRKPCWVLSTSVARAPRAPRVSVERLGETWLVRGDVVYG